MYFESCCLMSSIYTNFFQNFELIKGLNRPNTVFTKNVGWMMNNCFKFFLYLQMTSLITVLRWHVSNRDLVPRYFWLSNGETIQLKYVLPCEHWIDLAQPTEREFVLGGHARVHVDNAVFFFDNRVHSAKSVQYKHVETDLLGWHSWANQHNNRTVAEVNTCVWHELIRQK